MEPRSIETTPKKEDFTVDDVDSDYIPNDKKYLVIGKELKKLTRNAKKTRC